MKSEGIVQFIKFGVVGVANTAVDWVAFYILVHTVLHVETQAKAIAFVIAMINSYIWNTIWTFKKEYGSAVGKSGNAGKSKIFIKFVAVQLAGWVVNVAVFDYALKNVSFELINRDLFPLICASAAAVFWNFFANKFFTYKK